MSTICGTPTYVAPEVITGQIYGKAVDMWSAGVILYILLSGSVPFDDESEIKLFKKIARGDYDLSYEEWQAISEEAKDLIRGLMCVDPKKRLTADEALAHPWWSLEELSATVLQMTKLRTYVERLKMPVKRFRQGEFLVRQVRSCATSGYGRYPLWTGAWGLRRLCAPGSLRVPLLPAALHVRGQSTTAQHQPPSLTLAAPDPSSPCAGRGGRRGVPHQEGQVRDHRRGALRGGRRAHVRCASRCLTRAAFPRLSAARLRLLALWGLLGLRRGGAVGGGRQRLRTRGARCLLDRVWCPGKRAKQLCCTEGLFLNPLLPSSHPPTPPHPNPHLHSSVLKVANRGAGEFVGEMEVVVGSNGRFEELNDVGSDPTLRQKRQRGETQSMKNAFMDEKYMVRGNIGISHCVLGAEGRSSCDCVAGAPAAAVHRKPLVLRPGAGHSRTAAPRCRAWGRETRPPGNNRESERASESTRSPPPPCSALSGRRAGEEVRREVGGLEAHGVCARGDGRRSDGSEARGHAVGA